MEKVSAIVTCFNRENEIEACLQSLRWVDELIVVDSQSSDHTPELARKYADKFFQREYSSPGDQKNWAVQHASHLWILAIDSDEIMPEELRDEILETLKNPRFNQYQVYRRNFFLGKEMRHGGWNRDKLVILFKKNIYRYTVDVPHDHLVPEDERGSFKNRLIHYPHRSIDEFVKKSNRYATGGARKYFRAGRKGTACKMFLHAVFNFLRNYIFRLGILDGARGLIVATLSSCYVAEKYAKLWEREQGKLKGSREQAQTGISADEKIRPHRQK